MALALAGLAKGVADEFIELDKAKDKQTLEQIKASGKAKIFNLGPLMNLPTNPLKEADSKKRQDLSKDYFTQLVSHPNFEIYREAFLNPENERTYNSREGIDFRQKYEQLEMNTVAFFTRQVRGENQKPIGLNYFDEDIYKKVPDFRVKVHRARNTDPSSYTANIDVTAAELGLNNNIDTTFDNFDKNVQDITNPSNTDKQNSGEVPIAVEAPETDGERPSASKINQYTQRMFLEDTADVWSKSSTRGLENEEKAAYGEKILQLGINGGIDKAIATVSAYIPMYKKPSRENVLDLVGGPSEPALSPSEKDYWETKWSMADKVFKISASIWDVLKGDNGIFVAGAAANWQNVIENYMGAGGLFDQVSQVATNITNEGWRLGTFEKVGNKSKFVNRSADEEKQFLKDLGIGGDLTIQEHLEIAKGGGGKGGPARLESLLVAYAFAIAIANQDYQGGKAVSDADFQQAYRQVTGGLSQGSLFHGFRNVDVLLNTVKTVRNSLADDALSSYIMKKAKDGKKNQTREFMTSAVSQVGGQGYENAKAGVIFESIFGYDPFKGFVSMSKEYVARQGGGFKQISNVLGRGGGWTPTRFKRVGREETPDAARKNLLSGWKN